jgi:hypothetical protein
MNIPEFEIPTALYFLAPTLAISNFYYRKFDLALNGGVFAPTIVSSDIPTLEKVIAKKNKVALLANIYSTLHLLFYIYFFVKYDLFSAFVLTMISLIASPVFIKIEDLLFNSQSDFMSIYRISKLAQFISPITVLMMFYLLYIEGIK